MNNKDMSDAVTDLLGGKQQTVKKIKTDARCRNRASLSAVIDRNAVGYETVTFLANSESYNKIKEIAYIENITVKKVMEQAMNVAIRMYETSHGVIKPRKVKQNTDTNIFG